MNDETEKKASKKSPAADTPVEREYFFPAHGKTIVATSIEEANSKLKILLDQHSN